MLLVVVPFFNTKSNLQIFSYGLYFKTIPLSTSEGALLGAAVRKGFGWSLNVLFNS